MIKITYEDKMKFLEDLRERQKFLNESCKACLPDEELSKNIDIIECIMEDIRDFKIVQEQSKDNYKHWNLFYNGKTGQYLLYLYVDRKSDMLEIERSLYEKIKERVGS